MAQQITPNNLQNNDFCSNEPTNATPEISTPSFIPQNCCPEIDIVYGGTSEICVNNAGIKTSYLVRQKKSIDNANGSEISSITEYSIDGNIWSNTTPTGIISVGKCEIDTPKIDPELVCITNDNGETIVKGVMVFDISVNPPLQTIYLNGVDVTATYSVIPCDETTHVVEGGAWCDGGVNIIPFYETETNGNPSANIAFWFNPLTNSVVIPSGSQTAGACVTAPNNQVQTSTIIQLDSLGNIVGPTLRLDRIYDNAGVLISENYYDTVTGVATTLSPTATQIIDTHGLDTEIIELCDDNGRFLRHIGHMPGGQPASIWDTLIDGITPYTTVGVIHKCVDNSNLITGGALNVVAGSDINNTGTGTLFDGAPSSVDTGSIAGSLQSISVTALNVKDGWRDGMTPDQILVDCPDGTVSVVFDRTSQTFQVQKDTDSELRRDYRIRATGKAYANIIYTFI